MKAIRIARKGRPASLELCDLPEPVPGAHEIQIRVAAAGVNFADCLARQGYYPDAPKRPFVPGYEVAGRVSAVGREVRGFEPGQRVLAFTEFGGYAEYALAVPEVVRLLPPEADFERAAGLPVVFVTAHLALYGTGSLWPKARVLIHAAAGGLGQAAVQMALAAGCEVFGTAGSAEKTALLERMGVQHPIDYRATDFARVIRETAGVAGLDLIVDSVGGGFVRRELKLLAPGGRLVLCGAGGVSGRSTAGALRHVLGFPRVSTLRLLSRSRAVYGLNVLRIFRGHRALAGMTFDEVMRLFKTGVVDPPVTAVFPLAEAHRAHELLESRRSTGKIVLRVAESAAG